jgi:reverse gyrase
MFELGGQYENRIGKYTVQEINHPKMTVRYENGETAVLNMNIQGRIWENILAEIEARELSRSARAARTAAGANNNFYIKTVSMLAAEEMSAPDWRDRMTSFHESAANMKAGDRLIYFAIENQVFFAVATITGAVYELTTKDRFYDVDAEQNKYFPIDLDAQVINLEKAVTLDSVELESVSDVKKVLGRVGSYVKINEDDFELLAELLTEITEEDEEDEEIEEEEEFED